MKNTNLVTILTQETYKDFGGIRNEEDYLITENDARRLGKRITLTTEGVESLR